MCGGVRKRYKQTACICLCASGREVVCARETAREIIGEKAKERERKQLNECERETYTQRERVWVCFLSHTDKKKA